MWGIFSGEFQCLPVDDCSAVSYDSGALARGSESTSFYSAILNQSLIHFFYVQEPLPGTLERSKDELDTNLLILITEIFNVLLNFVPKVIISLNSLC